MPNQAKNQNDTKLKRYDLAERTALYGEAIVEFCGGISDTPVNRPLISQSVRAGTSIGANYMEADAASSKKDFRHKISICRKGSKETMHWLRMVAKANPAHAPRCRKLWKEAHELVLIFSSILQNSRGQ